MIRFNAKHFSQRRQIERIECLRTGSNGWKEGLSALLGQLACRRVHPTPWGSQVDWSSKHLIMLDFPNGLAMQCSDWTLLHPDLAWAGEVWELRLSLRFISASALSWSGCSWTLVSGQHGPWQNLSERGHLLNWSGELWLGAQHAWCLGVEGNDVWS